jgi:4-amino-4-deoxychorismate lyase
VRSTLVNGRYTNNISIKDRGFLYGDGVFRTMLVENYKPLYSKEQLQKLRQDAALINIKIPSNKTLLNDIKKISTQKRCIVKIIVTRGNSDRGYSYKNDIQPNLILQRSQFSKKEFIKNQKGVRVNSGKIPLQKSFFSEIKHLSRIESVMALSGKSHNIYDRILLDERKNIIQGAFHCIFFKKGKRITLPEINDYGLNGISRKLLIDYINHKELLLSIKKIKYNSLEKYDEMYLLNSVYGLIPVVQYDNYKFNLNPLFISLTNKNLKFNYDSK